MNHLEQGFLTCLISIPLFILSFVIIKAMIDDRKFKVLGILGSLIFNVFSGLLNGITIYSIFFKTNEFLSAPLAISITVTAQLLLMLAIAVYYEIYGRELTLEEYPTPPPPPNFYK